jgi:hypothetical protein
MKLRRAWRSGFRVGAESTCCQDADCLRARRSWDSEDAVLQKPLGHLTIENPHPHLGAASEPLAIAPFMLRGPAAFLSTRLGFHTGRVHSTSRSVSGWGRLSLGHMKKEKPRPSSLPRRCESKPERAGTGASWFPAGQSVLYFDSRREFQAGCEFCQESSFDKPGSGP